MSAVTFPDGRRIRGFPVKFSGEPSKDDNVVVKRFVEYDQSSWALAKDGKVFRLSHTADSSFPYRLDEVPQTLGAKVSLNGTWITEVEAEELVS